MTFYPIYEAYHANIKARKVRRVIEKMYENYPAETVAHVNEELAPASRGEERRQQYLEAPAGA